MDSQTPIQPNNLNPLKQPIKESWLTRHFLPAIFILAILAAISAGIYYWQTTSSLPPINFSPIHHVVPTLRSGQSDVPSDWKTYTNSEYGFEFKYPSNLDVSKTPTGVVQIIHSEDKNKNTEISGIWIYIKDNPNNWSPIQWWSEQNNNAGAFESPKNVKINGLEAIRVDSVPDSFSDTHFILNHNKKIFDILQNFGSEGDQILSTFKFTDFDNTVSKIIGPMGGTI